MGWGREGWYAKYFMNEIPLGPWRFCLPWESLLTKRLKHLHISWDICCAYTFSSSHIFLKMSPKAKIRYQTKILRWPNQELRAFLRLFWRPLSLPLLPSFAFRAHALYNECKWGTCIRFSPAMAEKGITLVWSREVGGWRSWGGGWEPSQECACSKERWAEGVCVWWGGRVGLGLRRYYAVKIKGKYSNANIFRAFCHSKLNITWS